MHTLLVHSIAEKILNEPRRNFATRNTMRRNFTTKLQCKCYNAIELLNEPVRAITIQIHWCIVWIDKQLHVSVVLFHSVFQDLEAWYQDVQSRLQLIPDPSYKLQYTPTCTAIQQLQVKCTNCHYNLPSWRPSPCKQPILISARNCISADHRQVAAHA